MVCGFKRVPSLPEEKQSHRLHYGNNTDVIDTLDMRYCPVVLLSNKRRKKPSSCSARCIRTFFLNTRKRRLNAIFLRESYFDRAFEDGMPLIDDFVIHRCYYGHSELVGAQEALKDLWETNVILVASQLSV